MASTTRTFRRGLASQCALPLVLLSIAATIAALTWHSPVSTGDVLPLATVFAGLALCTWWLRHYSRITVGPKGVTVKRIGYTVFTSWENVLDIEYRKPAAIEVKADLTNSPLTRALLHAVAWRDQFNYPGCRETLANGRLIALAPFAQHIRSGELRGAMRQYWPLREAAGVPSAPRVHSRLQQTAHA